MAYWHGYCYGLGGVCKLCAKAKWRGCAARLGWGAKLITQQNFAIFATQAKFSKNGQNSPLAIFRCVINLSIRLSEIEGDI